MLQRRGYPDHVVAAGLLHDVLEKTPTTRLELDREFGARISQMVASVSDDASISHEAERTRELRDRVARSNPEARAIFAADKIAKVRELALLPRPLISSNRYQAKLTHYRASLEMLQWVGGDVRLIERLREELARTGAWLMWRPRDDAA